LDPAEANKRLQAAVAAHKAGDLGRAEARHPRSLVAMYEFWCRKPVST
jgi:hypothetical protein